ncbi:GMC oxidoreductase [Poronia punctata]|nr:GMC oxidoreductase [Poronia punctata]
MAESNPITAPLPLRLPVPTSADAFTEDVWETLFALLDAVTPSIVVGAEVTDKKNQLQITETQCIEAYERIKKTMRDNAPDYAKFKEYLGSRIVEMPAYQDHIRRFVGNLHKTAQQDLARLLRILDTQIGSLAMTGYRVPVKDQPIAVREAIFQSWQNAWLSVFPYAAGIFMVIAKLAYAQLDPVLREISDYTDHQQDYKPGPSFEYDFMQFPAGDEPAVVDVDVVIVGSGCGGGVCAKVLAEAGHDVLVVDKGYHFTPSQLPMNAPTAAEYLMEGKLGLMTEDNSINVVAGSNWGGGGTINWSVSLQPQGFVRQDWADKGLPFFNTQEFQNCLDRVCGFMGVSDAHIRHNHGAQVILDGARKLGWHAKACPQNTGGAEHYCGRCFHGCGSAEKQGPAVSWLPAAARSGARFIEGLAVSKVLFDKKKKGEAVGIVGKWVSRDKDGNADSPLSDRTQRTVRVNAKKVIIAGGTLQSPLLLMRSGLKNPHIGRNLYLHPAAQVRAAFPQDVKCWEGGVITSVCTTFENLDGKGHGAKIETSCGIPYILLHGHPYENALQWKLDAVRVRQMANYISIVRDRDTGRVFPDPDDGRPRIDYKTSTFDRANSLAGIVGIAKLCYVQGATEIWPDVPGVPPFKRSTTSTSTPVTMAEYDESKFDQGINDPEFSEWIKLLERTGHDSPKAKWSCAHQMGTCRMSARPTDGVVDPKGKVWGTENLYVADASIFPTATGVNPMITNMAIADYISRCISTDLKKSGSSSGLRASL